MELIFKKIKKLQTPQLIEEVSNRLGIDEATVEKLSDSIVAGLFGAVLAHGDNAETEEIFKIFVSEMNDDREIGVYFPEYEADSKKNEATMVLGDTLLFNKRKVFISFLSVQTEVSEAQIEKLLTALTYTLGISLGRKLMKGDYSIMGLLGQIHAERNFFLGYIPSGVVSILGLPSLLAIGENLSSDAKVISNAVYYKIMHGNTSVKEKKANWKQWFFFRAAL